MEVLYLNTWLRVGEDGIYEAKYPISLKSLDFYLLTLKFSEGTFPGQVTKTQAKVPWQAIVARLKSFLFEN